MNTTVTNAYLAAIVESSDDAIISKNLDGIITSWNPAAEHIFGYSAAEAVGQSITLIIPPDHLDEEKQIIARLRCGRKIDHFETERRAKDGHLLEVSITVSPIRDETGAIIGASKVARNIGITRKLERELQHKAALLAEKDRRKDEFLAMLAHELRNPLASISNAVHLLTSPVLSIDRRSETGNIVKRQIMQMTRLLDDLLDVSRITQGKIEMKRKRIALSDIIQTAIETSTPLLGSRGHNLIVNLPETPVWIYGDPTRLAQVFSNLLNNAAKYSPRESHIIIDALPHENEVTVSVTDNGMGIASNMLEGIFEIFSQVDSSMEQTHGGLGIGLALVKSLIEKHGGTVEACSEGLGKGSQFVITLPVMAEDSLIVRQDNSPMPVLSEKSYKIMVVDDNEASAKTLGWMLEMLGHAVTLAKDGNEAIAKAKILLPDVAFLDIGLPGMNGYQICEAMRADKMLASAVIIAQSGWGQEEHLKRSKDAGFNQHLVKPIDFKGLQQLLAKVEDFKREKSGVRFPEAM